MPTRPTEHLRPLRPEATPAAASPPASPAAGPVQPFDARKEQVPSDFDQVARSYDLLTALNPGYRKHLRWSAERLAGRRGATGTALPPGAHVLDVCCGTGLSTMALARALPGARIDAVDASAGMLAVARRRRHHSGVRYVLGDAMRLGDVLAGPYDGALMAYGLRNMPDPDAALAGLRALLAPGARAVFHEYALDGSLRSRAVWEAVTRAVVIPAGVLATGTAGLWTYLRESVLRFDTASALAARLERAGFTDVQVLPTDGWQRGIVHSFVATNR